MPDVTEMTSNPQQLQTQLVVAQDAVASWDSLREVSFFLVSTWYGWANAIGQYVTNPHNENRFSPNLTLRPLQTLHSHQWQYFFATFIRGMDGTI